MQALLDTLVARYPSLVECRESIGGAYSLLCECFRSGGKVLVCGNGGSAADAEHIVGELMKGFTRSRRLTPELQSELREKYGKDGVRLGEGLEGALPAISLVSHSSLISAVSNDGAPDLVFAQQILGLGRAGDVLLAISTSGNSTNIRHALQMARTLGLKTIGLTGDTGGFMKPLCDIAICAPSNETHCIQELHLPIYHALCIMLEDEFFGGG